MLDQTSFSASALAKRIATLRASGERATTSSFQCPPDLASAMKVRDLVQLEGKVANAWKVAKSPDGTPVVSRRHACRLPTARLSSPDFTRF